MALTTKSNPTKASLVPLVSNFDMILDACRFTMPSLLTDADSSDAVKSSSDTFSFLKSLVRTARMRPAFLLTWSELTRYLVAFLKANLRPLVASRTASSTAGMQSPAEPSTFSGPVMSDPQPSADTGDDMLPVDSRVDSTPFVGSEAAAFRYLHLAARVAGVVDGAFAANTPSFAEPSPLLAPLPVSPGPTMSLTCTSNPPPRRS
mmetsp:Transcript_40163/g.100868  ORF Transcript_40163/g.100868 Transcript_40163/m.100868 type:complete len:205 (-) Transcript_40163:154-768(-)